VNLSKRDASKKFLDFSADLFSPLRPVRPFGRTRGRPERDISLESDARTARQQCRRARPPGRGEGRRCAGRESRM
jgi:hypothetical protein